VSISAWVRSISGSSSGVIRSQPSVIRFAGTSAPSASPRAHAGGQRAQRRRGEHRAHVERESLLAQPLDEADDEQRVAAELEEVVVAADAVDLQQLLPERGERAFDGALRRLERVAGQGVLVGRGQGLAIELAVGGEREGVEADEGGGQHVLGQRRREASAKACAGSPRAARRLRKQVRDEPLVPGASSRAITTASRTPAHARSFASISPSSMRKPRILTCASLRPR
jgi:hypothetical protein